MDRKRIAVLGFYGKGNLGDEAFKDAFARLLPEFDLSFLDCVPSSVNSDFDAAVIGGGNVLDNHWLGLDRITIPTAFVGISASVVSEGVRAVVEASKITIVRDKQTQNNIENSILVPDLAFAIERNRDDFIKQDPHILVLMNAHMIPKSGQAEYHTHAWNWFVHEFAGCMDHIANEYGLCVKFMAMSKNKDIDDHMAGLKIADKMRRKDMVRFGLPKEDTIKSIRASNMVITQRFHGAVFSTQMAHPFLAVGAHDKMRNYCAELPWSGYIDYYGFSKRGFLRAVADVAREDCKKLKRYSDGGRDAWIGLSSTIKERLFG